MIGIEVQPAYDAQALKKYCMKIDTRIDGPYTNMEVYDKADIKIVIEKQLPWQSDMLKILSQPPDARTVHWIYDPVGGTGKTIFSKYLGTEKNAVTLGWGKQADVLYVASQSPSDMYIIDLTRRKPKTVDWAEVYSSIESIKNGYYMSPKYQSAPVIRKNPHVVVFSNAVPDLRVFEKRGEI